MQVEDQAAGQSAAALPAGMSWRTRLERLRKPLVVVAAVGTVLGGLAGYVNLYRAVRAPAAAGATSADASPYVAPVSLLVLPLANLTGDPGRAHVADGLTAALVADLGRIEGAAVVPAAMAFTMQRENLTLQDLGAKVRARFVLQGSVQASGDALRITAQLYDTARAATLWSQVFEGTMQRLFEVQDAVTAQVRAAVAPTMTLVAAEDAMRRPEGRNVADLLLRYEALRVQPQSLARHREMERLARAALAAEPANLRAMAMLAQTLRLIADNFSGEVGDPPQIRRLEAESAALAREVYLRNPQETRVVWILAMDTLYRRDWPAAREWANRLVAAKSFINAGVVYRDLGLLDDALEQFQKSLAQPVFRPRVEPPANMALIAVFKNRPEDALRWLDQAQAIDSELAFTYCFRATAHGLRGDEAIARAAGAECLKRLPYYKGALGKQQSEDRLWPLMDPAERDALARRLIAAERLAGLPQE